MLKDTVQSLLAQSIIKDPEQKWEIIIVDNNSTDDTSAYLQELSKTNPEIRCFTERNQGLTHARNNVLKNARHEIIAYIDDDETADQNWAKEIIRVFAENDNVGCVAGPFLLWEEDIERIPKWFPRELYTILGHVPLPVSETDYVESIDGSGVTGGNMAISGVVVREKGIVFPATGRRGNLLMCDEDTLMARNIRAAGFRIFLAPRAKVHHKFLPERATINYTLRYYKGMAYTRYVPSKLPYYCVALLFSMLALPFKILFSYRRRLLLFARTCYNYYRMEACLSFYMKKN
jgi:glycosyltransferase involved in cell wall biosynthesis